MFLVNLFFLQGETKSELEKAQEEYKKDLQEFVNLLNEEEK